MPWIENTFKKSGSWFKTLFLKAAQAHIKITETAHDAIQWCKYSWITVTYGDMQRSTATTDAHICKFESFWLMSYLSCQISQHHSVLIHPSHTTAPLPRHFLLFWCLPLCKRGLHTCRTEYQHFFFCFSRVEYVTITPDGFRYRSQIFPTVNGLFRWFKDHYQEPVPGMEALHLLFIIYIR